jgi:hypothetical protein
MLPFKNILIHEDLTGGSCIAIEKVLEMYEPSITRIHLVHVYKDNPFPLWGWMDFLAYAPICTREEADRKLRSTVEEIRSRNNGCKVTGIFLETEGTVTNSLSRYIMDNDIDLVIANRQRRAAWPLQGNSLDSFRLTEQTGCAVLSVTQGCLNHPIRSILLPISSFIPEKKIHMAIALSKEFKACIHLMGLTVVNEHSNKANLSAFYNTYKLFREYGYEPQYKIINGIGTSSELYNYAEEIKADIVLVNPERETGFFHWLGQRFSKVSQPLSPLQILSIKPHLK